MFKESFITIALLSATTVFSQNVTNNIGVGINTTDIAPGSALQIESTTGGMVQPRMNSAQMEAIPTPLDGALVFNTTENNWFIFKNSSWQTFVKPETPSVVLNRGQTNNGVKIRTDNLPTAFPLNKQNIISDANGIFELTDKLGEIKVLRSGTYILSAGFSTQNLPSGNHSYKIEALLNNSNAVIITNGAVNLPSTDFWGTSGNNVLILQANDVLTVNYHLKGPVASSRTAAFFNIGLSKL